MKIFFSITFFTLFIVSCFGQSGPPAPGSTNSYGGTNTYYPQYTEPVFSYPTNATLKWEVSLSDASFLVPSIGPDGTIYDMQQDTLSAINPDGSTKWQASMESALAGAPIVGSDGNLYVNGNLGFYAFNLATGSNVWSLAGASSNFLYGYNSPWTMPALDTNGTIYFCGSDSNGNSTIDAITNGALKWTYATSADLTYGSPVVGADGTIDVFAYAIYPTPAIYALNASGSLKWSTNYFGVGFGGHPSAIAGDGTIYFAGDTFFCAVNPDGSLRWKFAATNYSLAATNFIFLQSPEVGPNGTIYVEANGPLDGSAYEYTNLLFALNTNGTVRWAFPVHQSGNIYPPTEFPQSSCAVAADGEIYVTSTDGIVYSLAPNGTINWFYQTDSTGLNAPVIGPDGTVYVNSTDEANLFAFNGAAPIACSAWPEFGKNSRHTASVVLGYVNSPQMQTNGFKFAMSSPTNMPVCACATSDFIYWTNMSQTVLTNGTANYLDTQSSNYAYRFYRAFPQ